MQDKIKNLKKIELHLHLDGSINLELMQKLTNLGLNDLKKQTIANKKCQDLKEYLTKFDLPISLMQTKENLTLIAKQLVNDLALENVIYAEIKIALMSHTKKGLTYDEIIEAVLKGLKTNKQVKTNLILCMRRGYPEDINIKTIETAYKYLNKGVVAIDLVGDEKQYKLKNYLKLFQIAKEKGIPFTIHAGEVDSLDLQEVLTLNPTRIGHGVKCIDNFKILKQIKEKNILLEICPTSNIQTKAFETYTNHPIKTLYDNKINISINTDNRTVSNINLTNEYLKLINNFNFTINDLKKINLNSINYTFLTPKEKISLFEKMVLKH